MNKRNRLILIFVLTASLLTACGNADAPAPASSGAEEILDTSLDTSHENALTVRNQLLLGTLNLEDSAQAVSAEQAAVLLPLWQGLRGTMNSGASAPAEVDALLKQIERTMSSEQLAGIRTMKLAQSDLQAWAQSQGLGAGSGGSTSFTGTGGGMGSGQGGGQNLSPEERAARQAERGGTGENRGGLSTALIESVISLLSQG
jgi:hypothetical protein